MTRLLYSPDWLYADGALHENASLAVGTDGRVEGIVGPDAPGQRVRLGGKLLLPGLVNAHSHAFQRVIRGRTEYVEQGRENDDFWSWRESMYRAATAMTPEEIHQVSRQAFLEMALAGITTVGEFHYLHHQPDGTPYADPAELSLQVARAAREVGLRVVMLEVAYARAGFDVPENPRQRRFIDRTLDAYLQRTEAVATAFRGDPGVSVGLAPHSVRAVPKDWLVGVAQARGGRVVHMHLSEQPAENRACRQEHGVTPTQLVRDSGLLGPHYTGVHGVHLDETDIELLGDATANVCACPSTERNLGDGIVPADALLRAGAHVSLGSDSQAHIDLLDEARQLEGHLRLLRLRRAVLDEGGGTPSGLAARLLRMATVNGARSLGVPVGTLSPGAPADFFTVDLQHPSVLGADRESLLAAVVFGAEKAAVRDVAVQGRLLLRDGHHPLAAKSARELEQVARRIFA